MELSDFIRMTRLYWRGLLAFLLVGLVAASLYSLTRTNVYTADASGFVSTGANDNPALASVGDTLAKSRATSYVDLAKSRATAEDVIRALGLKATPASLIANIDVSQPLDTVLIKMTARASTPLAAQQLADAWVAALTKQVSAIENPRGAVAANTLHIVPIESAALPTTPSYPNTKQNLALGLILGLLIGFGYALLRSQLDRRIRTAAGVERAVDITVVGAIPSSPGLEHAPGTMAPIAVDSPREGDRTHSAEAFRKLRTNLQFMNVDHPPRVIVMTSPQPGDGKSTIAANLAVAIAASDQPVVLIDGDLRRPSVADSFGLVEGAGLTDVLIGRATFEDVAQRSARYPHLQVLAAGGIPPNPSEMLGSQAMRKLLTKLGEDHIVIIDASPLLPVTDAALLTASADGAFVVISAGQTLDTELQSALKHLDAVNGKALGVILNRVSSRDSASGYYGGYYEAHDTAASSHDKSRAPVATA
jgi:capsular exopolysaccharide synthesis family protein